MIEVTNKTFEQEVAASSTPVIVDFWAPWCGPCKTMTPTLETLAGEYTDRVKFVKVNVDNEPELAVKFGIRSIPTLIAFKGGQVIQTSTGAKAKSAITAMVDPLLGE